MKLRILGSGTSSGVPRIGGDWGACDPAEPRNRRTRVSILVEHQGTRILVDTSPDMREQLLAAQVSDVDAVIWTHDHADHCHGIDDLRQLFHARGAPVAGYARAHTLQQLSERFSYAFTGGNGYPPTIIGSNLADHLAVGPIDISVVDQPHGSITSAGLRFDAGSTSLVYATDLNILTDEMLSLYKGCNVLVIDTLRRAPHPSHPTLEQALGWIASIGPKRAILTHMDQSMDYRTLAAQLPAGIEPGYDGMEILL